ncbi:MAG: hypothetical protein M3415_03255 [Actinomycetota bacterium]|nr:hypothetical protein [Actinomycetota bacterium]
MTDDPLGAWLRQTGDADARTAAARPAPAAAADGRSPQPDDLDTEREAAVDRVAALFVDERLPPAQGRRRPLLWVLAALPWLVVVALLLAPGESAPTPDAAGEERPRAAGNPAASESRPSPLAETRTAPLVDDRMLAAAAVAVRTAATATDGRARRYVDTVAAESVTSHGDVAVVTVRAVVLDGTADRWLRARPARFAVPMGSTGGEVVALADPWVLAPPPTPPTAPAWRPLAGRSTAAAAAAAATLQDAGYRDLGPVRSSVRDDLPGIVRTGVRARAPGERTVRRHTVWLTDGAPPQLLGASPPAPPPASVPLPNRPAPSPSTSPEALEQP